MILKLLNLIWDSGDTYYLVRKNEELSKVKLDCDNLDYDENYLYLFRNGDLPFYTVSKRTQGWFNGFGKKTKMEGKAQILEIVDQTILLRNYNDKTVYFIDTSQSIVSPIYKNIFLGEDDCYVVEDKDSKYFLINKEYEEILNEKFDFIDTSLARYGFYVCGDFGDDIELNDYGYAKMKMKLIHKSGNTIVENIEQAYGSYYRISDNIRNKEKRINDLKSQMTNMKFEFVGDKFYEKYK